MRITLTPVSQSTKAPQKAIAHMLAINKGDKPSMTPKTLHLDRAARERRAAVEETKWRFVSWKWDPSLCISGHCQSSGKCFSYHFYTSEITFFQMARTFLKVTWCSRNLLSG